MTILDSSVAGSREVMAQSYDEPRPAAKSCPFVAPRYPPRHRIFEVLAEIREHLKLYLPSDRLRFVPRLMTRQICLLISLGVCCSTI
jgi:hypothetical protein